MLSLNKLADNEPPSPKTTMKQPENGDANQSLKIVKDYCADLKAKFALHSAYCNKWAKPYPPYKHFITAHERGHFLHHAGQWHN